MARPEALINAGNRKREIHRKNHMYGFPTTQPSELSNEQDKRLGQTQLCFNLRRYGHLSIRSVQRHVCGRNAIDGSDAIVN